MKHPQPSCPSRFVRIRGVFLMYAAMWLAAASAAAQPETLTWSQDADALRISMPEDKPGDFAFVFKLYVR